MKTAFHRVSSVSGHRKRTLKCNSAHGKNMEQVARRRAFKCFTAFVVETIFPCAEHVLIKRPSDIQVIFSVVRTKWLFRFPFKPKTAQQKSISAKGAACRGRGRKPLPLADKLFNRHTPSRTCAGGRASGTEFLPFPEDRDHRVRRSR